MCFYIQQASEIAKVVIDEKVAMVTTGAGSPEPYMKAWKEAGIKVFPLAGSVAFARKMERYGADAIIAEGSEAGGHISDITTMALTPQIVSAVNIPVITAGGIASGAQIAAAFALGASGVQAGTIFLAATECNVHPEYKQLVIDAKDIDTIVTGKRLGHPVRALRTPFTRDFFKKEYDSAFSNEDLEKAGLGSYRCAIQSGDIEKGSFMAGQVAGMVKSERPAKEIIDELVTQTNEAIQKLQDISI